MSGAPGVFAVTDTALQVTWRHLDAGRVRIGAGHRSVEVEHPGGPGELRLDGLEPWTAVEVAIERNGTIVRRQRVRTGPPPPGRELFRFATISDLHLGEHRFGYFGTMREDPEPDEAHPVRCTRQAMRELTSWGAQLLVVKGDITNDGRRPEWELAGRLLGEAGQPVVALVGNHDAKPTERGGDGLLKRAVWYLRGGIVRVLVTEPITGEPISADEGMAVAGLDRGDGGNVHAVDRPGIRIILADTTIEHRHVGTFTQVGAEVTELAADARRSGRPVFVAGHHFPMPLPVPHFWPPGVPEPEARQFFTALRASNPNAFYSAGHTHRNRRYWRWGIPATEVGSPKDYPGAWAGYTVYEGGIRQTVWRVGSPDVLAWTEHSRRAALGAWGVWSPGRLADRCFLHLWPS